MISRTKYKIDNAAIERLFVNAGIDGVTKIAPLGAGEYNAVFSVTAKGKDYALKISPGDDDLVLTYENKMMPAEVFWYQQIQEHTDITVPKIFYTDFDQTLIPADYFIMEKLPGRPMDKIELSKSEKADSVAETARMAARIHKIKNDRFGYIQNGLYDDWYQAIRAMVNNILDDCARKGKRSKRGERLLAYIDRYKPVLEKAECCMVNADLWAPNIICKRENGEIKYAWIDPERSFWGDRIVDFICLEMMTPLADKEITLSAYNSAADTPVTADEEETIRYTVAQGYLGLILEAEKYYRYSLSHFGWWRNVFVSDLLYRNAFKILKG